MDLLENKNALPHASRALARAVYNIVKRTVNRPGMYIGSFLVSNNVAQKSVSVLYAPIPGVLHTSSGGTAFACSLVARPATGYPSCSSISALYGMHVHFGFGIYDKDL